MTATTETQPATPYVPEPPVGTQPLTALTRIIPGRREQLQQVLAGVNERIAAGGPTPLDVIGTVHFARWVVLPDGDDAGPAAVHQQLRRPVGRLHRGLRGAGRPSRSTRSTPTARAGRSAAPATSRPSRPTSASTRLRADVYYRAYPQATVQQVKSALRLRTAMNGLLAALNE